MYIVLFFFLIYKDAFSVKLRLQPTVSGFIANRHNKTISLHNQHPSIKNVNNHVDHSLNSSPDLDDYGSIPANSVDYSYRNPSNFKLRGVKLDDNLVPLNDYVLILKSDVNDVTKSGVYIGSKKSRDFVGSVLAVGPGRLNIDTGVLTPLSVSVGDYVIYDMPDETVDLKYKDTPCVLVKEENIYARIALPKNALDNSISYDRIVPLSDRLLLRVLESPKRTESGLVISRTNNKDDLIKAKIVSMGPGSYTNDGRLIPIKDLKVGDVVMYSERVSERGEFSAEGVNYSFIRRNAVLARL
ncbi:chaperonin [Theileria orientalis]|uniref:Chaperonin n=1 Tax=Theileria orientalis TaxID=68886 RepID=A0A976M7W7_THEOR|nr:chaperonin [Theileria orientalis]